MSIDLPCYNWVCVGSN